MRVSLSFHHLCCIFCAATFLFVWSPIRGENYSTYNEIQLVKDHSRFFDKESYEDSIDIAVDYIIFLRDTIVSQGIAFPGFRDFISQQWDVLSQWGIKLPASDLEVMIEKFRLIEMKRSGVEDVIMKGDKVVKKTKIHRPHVKMSPKMCFGFLKFLNGSICCLVPMPSIQGIGMFMAGQGLAEMVDEAREEEARRNFMEYMSDEERKLLTP